MHRAYQIVEAVRDLIRDANTLAGPRVEVGRLYSISLEQLPFISIEIGEDAPVSNVGTDNTSTIDSILTVPVDLYESRNTVPDANLLQMRAETHTALMADDTLGLAFVLNVIYAGADGAFKDPENKKPIVMLRTYWNVHYRMNYLDPS